MNNTQALISRFLLVVFLLLAIVKSSFSYSPNTDSLDYYYKLAFRYYNNDSSKYSFRAIQKAISYCDTIDQKHKLGKLYGLNGYLLLNRGATFKAIESFSISKKIGVEINNSELIVAGYHGLGRTYVVLRNFEEAKKNLKKGIKYSKEFNFIAAEAIMYNAIGVLEDSQNNNEKAIEYFTKFLSISEVRKDTLSIIYANVNIGEVYIGMHKVDLAFTYIKKADILNSIINNAQADANILSNYARIAFEKEDFSSSINFVNKSLKISFDNNFSEFILSNYYILIDNYKAIHNVEKAISLYNKLDHYKDSIHQINDTKRINALNSYIKIQEKEAEAKFWEQKYHNHNIILGLTISLAVAVLILLIILFRMYKLSKLHFSKKNKDLSNTIDEKNRELVTKIITENQHDTLVELISEKIEDISKRNSMEDVKEDLQLLKRNITIQEQITNSWDSFRVQFRKVHPTFFNSLLDLQPNLTQNELRMCAYIKMNMSTKEIANILNISDRSIQTNRYRLKKKLNLSQEIDLITYIQAV